MRTLTVHAAHRIRHVQVGVPVLALPLAVLGPLIGVLTVVTVHLALTTHCAELRAPAAWLELTSHFRLSSAMLPLLP